MGIYDGTAVNSPTFGAAKFSTGLTVVDTNNHIALNPSPMNFLAGASWTVEAWIKFTSTATEVWASFGGSTNRSFFGISGNKARGGFAGYGANLDGTTNINDGAFHHVAFVCTSGTSIKLFVDGVLENTGTGTLLAPTGEGRIGYLINADFHWTGTGIDELAVWSVAKYSSNFTPSASAYTGIESSLVALYHLNGNALDSVPVFTQSDPTIGEYGPTTVALSWPVASNGTGAVTYQVQRAPDSAGSPGTFANTGSPQSGLTFIDTGLTAATKYWWRIRATDSLALVATSGNVTVTTLASGIKYNRLDTTSSNGQNIVVLVPNANAAIPYAGELTPLILFMHANGNDQTQPVISESAAMMVAFMDAGWIVACSNSHGNNWGNQSAIDDQTDMDTKVISLYQISDRLIFSTSMGGVVGLLCHVPRIKGLCGIYPVCNLGGMYDGGTGTFADIIEAAYSCNEATYSTATAGHDPVLLEGSAFHASKMLIFASPDDVAVPKNENADVLAAIVEPNVEVTVVTCSGAHGNVSHWQPSVVVDFYNECLAASGGGGSLLNGGLIS